MTQRALILVVVAIGCVLCAAQASAATLHWSSLDQVEYGGGNALGSVACGGGTDCVALDTFGRVVRLQLHPSAPGGYPGVSFPAVLGTSAPATAIACADGDCTAVTDTGGEATFQLASPIRRVRSARVDPAAADVRAPGPPGIACPTSSLCVIADDAGNLVTFDPADPGDATRTALDPGGSFVAVACPSASQCTAISATERWTFAPADPATNTTAMIESSAARATALACPTTTQCTSVDTAGRESTFDPQSSTAGVPVAVSSDPHADDASVACPTASVCIAADRDGTLDSFDPATGASLSHVPAAYVDDIACASATQCLADTRIGSAQLVTPGSARASIRFPVDVGRSLLSVACPSARQCVTEDGTFELAFGASGIQENLLLSFGPYGGLACPLTSLCTLAGGNGEETFDPARYSSTESYHSLRSAGTLTAVRCPGRSECVGIDSRGTAVTYAPASGHVLRSNIGVDAGRALTAVACPTSAQCTATDATGAAISFDPLSGRRLLSLSVDRAAGLVGIACTGTRTCVAIDSRGNLVSFNPDSAHGITFKHVDNLAAFTAVACPSSGQCLATDGDGRVFSGRPFGSRWTPTTLSGAVALTAITCVDATDCVAVDAAGGAFTSR